MEGDQTIEQCAETEAPEQWEDQQVPSVPLQPEDFPADCTVDQHVSLSTGHPFGNDMEGSVAESNYKHNHMSSVSFINLKGSMATLALVTIKE